MTSRAPAGGLLRREVTYLIVALQFLTRLPVPPLQRFEARWLDAASAYFPLVGWLVGAIAAAVFWGAAALLPGPALPAIIAVAASMLVTGAFHEDGLADTFDGLGGGLTRERKLEIMKDSRIGTYGMCALTTALAVKAASLSALPLAHAVAALFVVNAGARIVPVAASALLPYGGDSAGAKVAPIEPSPQRLLLALVTGLLPFLFLPMAAAIVALMAGTLAAVLILSWAWRAIGGHTGDVLGAAEQAFETAALVGLAAVLAR